MVLLPLFFLLESSHSWLFLLTAVSLRRCFAVVFVVLLLICIKPQLNFVVFFFAHLHTAQRRANDSLPRLFLLSHSPLYGLSCRMSFSFLAQWISCLMKFFFTSSSTCVYACSKKKTWRVSNTAGKVSRKSYHASIISIKHFSPTTRVTSWCWASGRGEKGTYQLTRNTETRRTLVASVERQWKHFSHQFFFNFTTEPLPFDTYLSSWNSLARITVDSLHWPPLSLSVAHRRIN